jgi:phosphoribosyl-ATP pyrophosphohydrolase
MKQNIIESLYRVLVERKSGDPEKSYVASLYRAGTGKICHKIIEEAQETIVEALNGDNEKLKSESADLVFHLMVLWAAQGIAPTDIFEILEKRMGIGGLQEKAQRKT